MNAMKNAAGNHHRKMNTRKSTTSRPNTKTRKYQPMNCNPIVDKISIKNSCYTPKILFMIRDAYNKDHDGEAKIKETDPAKLWKVLNARFVQCRKEDCWLNEIKNPDLKKRIDRYLFAPDKPYEWKSNPNEWLSNFDIMNVLEQYEQTYKHFEFIGPTPIDFDKVVNGRCIQSELCKFDLQTHIKNGKTQIGVIFNLSPHTSSGSHWVSLFIDTNEQIIFYFDSAGEPIPAEIKMFVDRIQTQTLANYTFHQNWPNEHQMGNTECGVYSLFFIITMLTGNVNFYKKRMHNMNMRQKIRLFKRHTIPDKYIEKYRNIYFND